LNRIEAPAVIAEANRLVDMTTPTQPSDATAHVSPDGLGVTVMPEWFQCEGIDAVLDRIESIGANAIVTSPYLLERVPAGEGAREPPPDGEAGKVRPLDRELFGARELHVRTAPAFAHDMARYSGLRYQPAPPADLTRANGDLLDRMIESATRRGIDVFMQVMAASPPGYRVQFSGATDDDQCLGPDLKQHPSRVDRNASLASPQVGEYTATLLAELADRYPAVAGFRLDWPEYPPYDLESALFDFNPAAQALMRSAGDDPHEVARAALDWLAGARAAAVAAGDSVSSARAALEPSWRMMFDPDGDLAPLFAAKRAAAHRLVTRCRAGLDGVAGSRRRLELQAFPAPFDALSGFPLRQLAGVADAIGIKLYTMHWPMIARYWTRDLVGTMTGSRADSIALAVAQLFDLIDAIPDPARFRYPEAHEAHPVGSGAQRRKLATARDAAGSVPVIAFAHSYGPVDDVVRRVELAREHGPTWINRYGYLSDVKLMALRR
jgi:hypothetical protein